jgi:hypothetical protein
LADVQNRQICLAMAYYKLGRRTEAKSLLADINREWGEDQAVFTAMIYTEWGDKARALDNLETAFRLRQSYLIYLKSDSVWDPLRKEPRFQAILKALKFPD